MTLPEAVPAVTYDFAVSEHAAWIDFDYDAFYGMATAAGLNHAQIERLSIKFTAETGDTPLQDALQKQPGQQYLMGNYNPVLNQAKIYISTIRELHARQSIASSEDSDIVVEPVQDQLNRTAIHETGHHVDWHLGSYKWNVTKRLARIALSNRVKKMAAKKESGHFLNNLAAVLEEGVHSYGDKNSPLEQPAYSFETVNASRYEIVAYETTGKFEIWEASDS